MGLKKHLDRGLNTEHVGQTTDGLGSNNPHTTRPSWLSCPVGLPSPLPEFCNRILLSRPKFTRICNLIPSKIDQNLPESVTGSPPIARGPLVSALCLRALPCIPDISGVVCKNNIGGGAGTSEMLAPPAKLLSSKTLIRLSQLSVKFPEWEKLGGCFLPALSRLRRRISR